MNEELSSRYNLDFSIIPKMYHYSPAMFAQQFLQRAEDFLAGLFNDVYRDNCGGIIGNTGRVVRFFGRKRNFASKDFEKTIIRCPENTVIVYVTLPPADDKALDYCEAYAVVLNDHDCQLFLIDRSTDGEYFVSTVDENGRRIRICTAEEKHQENFPLLFLLFQQRA